MRAWLLLLPGLLGGCGTHSSYFESNAGGAPDCLAMPGEAGRYRCDAWALIAQSRENTADAERLTAAAATRFQVADGLDRGFMTAEDAARIVGQDAAPRTAATK